MAEFDGKVAIVTGGALGMGRATALAFAREGASVTVADVNDGAGRKVVAEMPSGRGLFVPADVAGSADCQRVVEETVRAFGGVDVLFNNVGIQPPDSYLNVEQAPEELWDRIMDVNLKSYFLMAKYAIPQMRRRGGGAIVNNASVQGLQSMPGVPPYAASKGGVLSLTRQMAVEYAREHIRVVAICPGTIDTEMVRAVAAREPDGVEAALKRYGQSHPIGRIGTGQDIANAVLFLASDRASFITGEYLCVDGGYMALGAWAGGAGASE
ncbi:MAG TPA: glucose 1-dehydrogenase [Chloroflexota bacterium]|jgi:NAD(P)-dependent dehydrogenase (short-subunit alcohol dehydrogenase family)|nr:glucose 1-dehydrogenase [Chloroflexota bacterium]